MGCLIGDFYPCIKGRREPGWAVWCQKGCRGTVGGSVRWVGSVVDQKRFRIFGKFSWE